LSKEEPTFRERSRAKGERSPPKQSGAKFDFADILRGNLRVKLDINPEDREIILGKLDEIAAKVDYRWKFTQWIMVVAIALGTIGQVVTWTLT